MAHRSLYLVACLGYSKTADDYNHVRYVTELNGDIPAFGSNKPLSFRNVMEANAIRDKLVRNGWLAVTIAAPIHFSLGN
jgi:hypothetical protein